MEGAIEMKYKAGDKVWVQCDRLDYNLKGELPGIVTGASSYPSHPYTVELSCGVTNKTGEWYAKESWLRPRRDPDEYDGNRVVKWDDCPWQPEKVLVER
jgi:hypothetical protein